MKKSQAVFIMTTRSNHRQTFPIDGFENDFMLELMLFEQVTNAKAISDSIKSGAFDVEVALMNPKTVFTEDIVRLATFKASDTTAAATETEPKTSSSFSLEPIAKPKIKWSGNLPEISPVPPFLISEENSSSAEKDSEVTAGAEAGAAGAAAKK